MSYNTEVKRITNQYDKGLKMIKEGVSQILLAKKNAKYVESFFPNNHCERIDDLANIHPDDLRESLCQLIKES